MGQPFPSHLLPLFANAVRGKELWGRSPGTHGKPFWEGPFWRRTKQSRLGHRCCVVCCLLILCKGDGFGEIVEFWFATVNKNETEGCNKRAAGGSTLGYSFIDFFISFYEARLPLYKQ